MEFNLKLKEEEFRKINEQLELKNRELTEKVEDVLRIQENFSYENFFQKQDDCADAATKYDNFYKPDAENKSRGMLACYKAKIKAVQLQLEKLQSEIKIKVEEIKKIQKDNQSLSEEKEKWFLQYNLEKNNNSKLEKEIAGCHTKLQLKETDNSSLKKEVENLKNELKSVNKELNISESRLKKAHDEAERAKIALKNLRQESKESQENQKRSMHDLTATVKQIQKHKSELLAGYKRQIQLIENLKKQKAHIGSCKVADLAETEFLKLLDWKLD